MNKAYEVVKKGWHGSHHHFFSDISIKMKSLKWHFQCLKNHCIPIYGYSLSSGFVSLPLNKHSNCRPRKTWILSSYLAPRDSRVMLSLNKIIKCTVGFFSSLGIPQYSRAIERVVMLSDLAHQQLCLLNMDIDFSHPGMRRWSIPPALLPVSFQQMQKQWWLRIKAQGIRDGSSIINSLLPIQVFFVNYEIHLICLRGN